MKAIKRTIFLCWIMLIVCFIIKLFGGNWFEIMCDNEHFIYICNYIDERLWLKYIIAFILYVPSTFLLMLSCCLLPKPNWKQTITILAFIVVVWSTQFLSDIAKMVFEVVMFITLPTTTKIMGAEKTDLKTAIKSSWHLGVIGCALDLLFQVISLITRNIGIKITDTSTLITLILMIDYYIMIAIYFLYVTLKSKKE